MAKILVQVCQSCIDLQRNPNDSQGCAIYSALKKEYPDKDCDARLSELKVGEYVFFSMPEVIGWQMGNHHNSTRSKPITLCLDTENWSASIASSM